ncbi:MAG: ABC transporter ATP-binding protein [Verrucomicrobiales bacterium]|nr:ABC transporter ATP-binding protein [Verrucomicrobiales bacterium]
MSRGTSITTPPAAAAASGVGAATTPEPVLQVEQATLGYGRRAILREVSLRIGQGEFWCLLGSNGEGKTTLIKALLGAIRPIRGRVLLRADFQRRTRLAFVPQEVEVNAALPTTVAEFVSGGFVGLNLEARQRAQRLARVLELMGIPMLRDRSLWALSGGQRQRALVARALVRDPLLLIVDEPTAGLDLAAATGLLETITRLNREHRITVVFVTHDLQIAAQRATHAALFKHGRVVSGPLAEVFTDEHLGRTFGVPVRVVRDGVGGCSVVASNDLGGSSTPGSAAAAGTDFNFVPNLAPV